MKRIVSFLCVLMSLCMIFAACTPKDGEVTPEPATEQPTEQAEQPTEDAAQLRMVNINTAGVDELDSLPGIGPVLAQRIVDWRTENGPFTDAAQLLEVDGIGQTVLESIQDFIVTEDTQE